MRRLLWIGLSMLLAALLLYCLWGKRGHPDTIGTPTPQHTRIMEQIL